MGLETINQGHATNDFESQKKFLPILLQQTSRMETLVSDLLSLSKIELEEHIRPTDKLDLKEIISHVVEIHKQIIKKNDISVDIKGEESKYIILGHRDRLIEVFTNLIDNAIKYSPKGKKIYISLVNNNESITVSVRDEGIGIPKKYIPRITERFFRVDPAKSKEVGGTGLGLAIVKHIANQHRAETDIKSEEGKGTEFILTFPNS